MLLSPVLAELVSGSTPATVFFAPATLALFTLLGYGLPVLLIREFVVAKNLDNRAVFLLGLAYGIYNEGLLAKTIVLARNLPIREFDDYGFFGGISIPWAVSISIWHAASAVLFPIVFTHRLFPAESRESWLGKRTAIVLGVLAVGTAMIGFLGKSHVQGTVPQAGVLLALILACLALATRFRTRTEPDGKLLATKWQPVFLGLSTIVAYALVTHVAAAKPPLIVFFLTLAAVVLTYRAVFLKARWSGNDSLILFGIGYYIQSALLGMAAHLVQGSAVLPAFVFGVLAEFILVTSARKMSSYEPQLAQSRTAPSKSGPWNV